MITERQIAEWMLAQFKTSKYLYQEVIVYKIRKEFGEQFVYTNENGNLAIGKNILKHFRKITEGKVVWERSERVWRKLQENETYKRRQVE